MILQNFLVMKKATFNITKAKVYAWWCSCYVRRGSVCGNLRMCVSLSFLTTSIYMHAIAMAT